MQRLSRLFARGLPGRDQGGQHGDVQTRELVIEVKSRRQATPKLISGAWEQATAAAEATGKDPLVVLAYTPGVGKPREFWEVRKVEPGEIRVGG